jgi:hypothetical protein
VQVETLKTVYAKKINTFQRVNKNGTTTIYQGLISKDECDLIVKQEIRFDKMNQSFTYENS